VNRVRNLAQAIAVCESYGMRLEDWPLDQDVYLWSDGSIEIRDHAADMADAAGRAAVVTLDMLRGAR
jgi:hypothetical protein